MASKIKYKTQDDFDINDSLDIPDFDFDLPKQKDNRSPTEKVGKAALKGAAKAVFSASTIETAIRRGMPKSYGQGLDLLAESNSSIKSLYNTAAKEFKPTINQLKQITKRSIPTIETKLPKGMSERLKAWANGDKVPGANLDDEYQRSQALLIEIGSIFQAQTQQDQVRDKNEEQREYFRQGLEQVRHRDQLGQLDAIRVGIDRLASYQDATLANFQKKSLELQYRQYFATADLLETTKRAQADNMARFDAIVKNTGLPDYVKQTTNERFKEMTRNRFIEGIRDKMFGGDSAEYIKRFTANITKSIKEKISNTANLTNAISDAASMAHDSLSMSSEFGGDMHEDIGEALGGMLGGFGVHLGIPKLRKAINKHGKGVLNHGEKLRYRINNAGQLLNQHLQDDTKSWGAFNFAKQFLAENAPGLESDVKMSSDELMKMGQPMVYNRHANKSLTEIIPGLLSHIHRELKVMRTGDDNVGLLSYDMEGNTFKDSKILGQQIRDSIVGKSGREAVAHRAKQVLSFIEENGTQLTDEQRKSIVSKVTELGFRNKNTDASVMTRSSTWGKGPEAQKLAKVFSALFETDVYGKRSDSMRSNTNQRKFDELVKSIPIDLSDPRARIQAMVNSGQYDMLRQAGIIDKNGSINRNQIYQDMLDEPDYGASDSTGRRRRRGLRNKAGQPVSYNNAAHPQPYSAHSDSSVIEQGMHDLKETLRQNSTVQKTEEIATTLLRIENSINNAAILLSSQYSSDQLMQAQRAMQENQKFWDRSVGSVIGGGFKNIGKLGIGVFNHARQIGKRFDRLAGAALGLGQSAVKGTLKTVAMFFGDVYVKGENFPRLTKVKMQAGEYFDQKTGKVLTSLRDISGAVVDRDGNVILSAEELKNAYMKGRGIRGVMSLASMGLNFGFKEISNISERLGGVYGTAFKIGKAALKGGIRALIPVSDVYIKGTSDPLLYRWKFLKGQYFSKKTGKIISHQKDIDGPVMDEDGNVVLSEDQINLGLVDKNGRDIHFNIGNLTGMALRAGVHLAKKGYHLVKGIASRLRTGANAVLDGIAGVFSGFTYMGKENLEVSKTALDVQKQILQVLLDRLPKRKKVFGDSDGDGIRDGSYEDLENKKSKLKSAKDALLGSKGKDGQATPGFLGGAFSGIASLFNKFKGGSGAATGAAAAGTAAAAEGSALGAVAESAVGAGAGALAAKFGLGSMLKGGLGLAGRAGMGLVTGLGGLALRGGAALLGLVSTPVLLAGLGLTAAYYGYKYLSRKKLETLSTVRFAQYGFDKSETDRVAGVFQLEDMLEPLVTIDNGEAKIDESKMNIDDALQLFGVNKNDKDAVTTWKYWYENRFKPVFLGHMAVIKNTHPGLKIADVDSKLEAPEKLKYLEATALPGVNYNLTTPAFSGQKALMMTESDVGTVRELARVQLEKDNKDVVAKKAQGDAGLLATAMKTFKQGFNTTVATVSTAMGLAPAKPPVPKTTTANAAGVKLNQAVANSSQYILLNKNRLDALQALRFKAYGLTTMDEDKVKALTELEAATLPSVDFNKKEVNFNGDGEKVLDMVKGFFGISGYRSPQGYRWMTWYQDRFLPVYLGYLQALYKATDKTDPKAAIQALEPKDQLSIANAIKSMTTPHDGSRVSIWQVTESPWDDYVLNNDPDSVKGNIDAITEVSKAQILGQVSTVADEQKKRIDDYKQNNPPKSTGNVFKDIINKGLNIFQNNTPYKTIDPSGKGVGAQGDYKSGDVIQHPGNGTGGDINSLPKPGANGWQGMKGVIAAASAASGVDNKLMASLAAVESDFNANAGAGTSTALGLFQFTGDTWNRYLKKYGSKYGIAIGTPATDARANALMAAEFMKDNIEILKRILKRPITSTDVYLMHMLGTPDGPKFLQADPSEIGAKVVPKAAASNKNVFYNSQGEALTCGEIYKNFTNKLINHLKQAGATDADFASKGDLTLGTTTVIRAPKNGLVLKLQRDPSTDSGTYGKLTLPDGTTFETLELAWRENTPQKSCIPPGRYSCVMKSNAKFGSVYEIQGVPDRSGILIHAGNLAGNVDKGQKSDVSGCVLLGNKRSEVSGQPAVIGSREAIGAFSQKLGGQPFMLEVISSISDQSSIVQVDKSTVGVKTAVTAVGKVDIPTSKPAATANSSMSASAANGNSSGSPMSGYGSSITGTTGGIQQTGPSPVRVNPGFRGFDQSASPSSGEIVAQDKASRNALSSGIDAMNKTLSASLDVQSESKDLLKSILQQMTMKVSSSGSDKNTSPLTAVKPTESAATPVVSMKRLS